MTSTPASKPRGLGPTTDSVVVTGGCGFIGHHLVRALLEGGHRVTVLDDLSTGDLERLPDHPALTLVEGSVLDPGAVRRAAEGAGLVFHLASVVGMVRATADPALTYRVAAEGTRVVLAHTAKAPVVLFSSSAVYGLDSHGVSREEDAQPWSGALAYDGGSHGYACGKWSTEEAGLAATAGRQVLILRPFNVVGAGQSSAYGMVLPRFLAQARRGQPLTLYDDGLQRRCFSEVGIFVETLLRLVGTPEAWRPGGNVLNIGSAESTAILDLARLVLAATGSRSPIERRPYEVVFPGKRDVRDRIPALARLTALVGEVSWPTIEEIVRETAAADVDSDTARQPMRSR